MAVEHAPEGGKGFWEVCLKPVPVGLNARLNRTPGLVSLLPEQALFSWGWRLLFLASIILLAVGWYIRVKVPESPDFEKVNNSPKKSKFRLFRF